MSLQDESFPADDLFDQLNNHSMRLGPSSGSGRGGSSTRILQQNSSTTSPFLNSNSAEHYSYTEAANTSGKTCASDPMSLEQGEEEINPQGNDNENGGVNPQLSTGRTSKAVSYQDIHSAYTKRRFKHVDSKVGQYIAAIDAEAQQRRSNKFQRHRSMPESLTPNAVQQDVHHSAVELHQLNKQHNRSDGERDELASSESYEQLLHEKQRLENDTQRLQYYSDYLQSKLDEKIEESILLKRSINMMRIELTDCKEKIKEQTKISQRRSSQQSLQSLLYRPIMSIATGTQTDSPPLPTSTTLATSTDGPAAENRHGNANLNVTYNSSGLSAGSIEVALLSASTTNKNKPNIANCQPLELNFSNDSNEVDSNVNAIASAGNAVDSNRSSSNRIATNNSGSSHPSSNDSAIEVEVLELRSPVPDSNRQQHRRQPRAMDFAHCERVYFFDRRNNRVLELDKLQLTNAASHMNLTAASVQFNDTSTSSIKFIKTKSSLRSRMLRLLGPCARCEDPNQSLDAASATYAAIPLLDERYERVSRIVH